MAFHQLEPPIPLHVIGKGDGYALAAIDYGQEHNLIWVTAINNTGEIWCAPNPQVRLLPNWSMGRARSRDQGRDVQGASGNVAANSAEAPGAA